MSVLFIGASLIEGWRSVATALWTSRLEPLGALNLGIPGETSGQLWWRLKNNFLRGIEPRVVVVQVGANDTNLNASQIAQVIRDILVELKTQRKDARIILCGALPTSGRYAELAPKHVEVNRLIALYAEERVTVLDPTPLLVDENGLLRADFSTDGLHLNVAGYEAWATQLLPAITSLASRS